MTQTEELLKLSIIYRRLIDEIVAIGGIDFTPEQKHRMMQVVSDAVGEAVNAFTARCSRCDAPIELVCDACEVISDRHGPMG